MEKNIKTKDMAIIAMDLKKVDEEMDRWKEQRLKKGNIYRAFSEYIICLENSLKHEENSYKRYLLEEEIKELKKEQKKYYVPSLLEMASYDLFQEQHSNLNEDNESDLQIATRGIKKTNCITRFVKSLKK